MWVYSRGELTSWIARTITVIDSVLHIHGS
jgi:hypothetical protein